MLYTEYKGEEVRSFLLVGQHGSKAQLWIDPPSPTGEVGVHAWDYRRRREDYVTNVGALESCLDQALEVAEGWLRRPGGRLNP